MILFDVNVLLYAYRDDSPRHKEFKSWLEDLLSSGEPFAYCDLVLSSFLRIVTHPKIYNPPTPMKEAFRFLSSILHLPQATPLRPGEKHWEIFRKFCLLKEVKGALVTDAYLAALAVESGCEWISDDKDFEIFPGLDWRRPV